jgi:NADH-quinone oxidoreductase subunit N
MNNASFLAIAPEVALLAGALIVIILGVMLDRPRRDWGFVAALSFVVAMVVSVLQWRAVDELIAEGSDLLFFSARSVPILRNPMVVMDHYSAFAGFAIFTVGLIGLGAVWALVQRVRDRGVELVALILLAFAGLHMMAMSANTIMLFLGLETASIAFYVVAGFTRTRPEADEAAVKYFLLGSLASAIFVYGAAMLFAATGSTSFYGAGGMKSFLSASIVSEPGVLLLGMGLVIVGLAFKVSAAPFHQWAPDVYQGAPTGAVGLMAAGVKVAGFAALGRILIGALPSQIDEWAPILSIIAGLSMVIGTAVAAVQTDVKRLLAYSGVAHAGYIMMAFVAGEAGVGAMWFYVFVYALTLVGAFAIVSVVSRTSTGGSSLDDWAGLARRSPEMAWSMLVLLLAMGGIPFTAGFVAKVSVFTAAADAGYLWLTIFALLTTVVGLYVYFRVAAKMFFAAPAEDAPDIGISTELRMVVAVVVVAIVALGIYPWPLLDLVREALPL